jgi:hypothetical protein
MSFAGSHRRVPAWAIAVTVAVIFLGTVVLARMSGHWNTNLPQSIYMELVPKANEFSHP